MTRKTRNYIFLIILLLLASVACIGYYMYNKGPRNIKNSSAIEVNAVELYDAYSKDSTAAGKLYTDKILSVTGVVFEAVVNRDQKKVFTLNTNESGAFINCTMEEDTEAMHKGDKIKIKGLCSGIGSGDADLGIKGDVYLTRCYLEK